MQPVPTFKDISQPKFEHMPIDMHGMTDQEQIDYDQSHPPRYRLIEDWIITLADGTKLIIPKGFITDFASIPRELFFMILPDGPLYLGSIFHDFGYQYGYLLTIREEAKQYEQGSLDFYNQDPAAFGPYMPLYVGYPQNWFDQFLRDLTISATGATVQAKQAYEGITLFGHIAWNKYRTNGPSAYGTISLALPGAILPQ